MSGAGLDATVQEELLPSTADALYTERDRESTVTLVAAPQDATAALLDATSAGRPLQPAQIGPEDFVVIHRIHGSAGASHLMVPRNPYDSGV